MKEKLIVKVYKYGDYFGTYNTVKEAAQCTGLSCSRVSKILKLGCQSQTGFSYRREYVKVMDDDGNILTDYLTMRKPKALHVINKDARQNGVHYGLQSAIDADIIPKWDKESHRFKR